MGGNNFDVAMKWTFAIILTLLFCSCSTYQLRNRKNSCCAKLYEQIPAVWQYDSTRKVFIFNQSVGERMGFNPMFFELHFNDCFVGLNKEKILDLFGKPSRILGNSFEYYTSMGCHGRGNGQCNYLRMVFDSESGKLAQMTQSARISSN